MPDITMCEGKNCPKKDQCYRFWATPSKYRQSYFVEEPFENEECKYFWPSKDENKGGPKKLKKT